MSFWRKPLRTSHKWPHPSTLLVFLCENELFQRGWGVFVILVEIPEGWGGGGINPLQKWKIQGGGGILSEIPSVVGVWIFSGTTHLTNLKSCWQILRLTFNSVTDAMVVCWGVYTDFVNLSTAVNWVLFRLLLQYKHNCDTENSQLAQISFWSAVLEK